jgi:hypothetical protein
VCVLAAIAVIAIGGRIDWSSLRRGYRPPRPIYLRVDQRPALSYERPDLRRRALSTGALVLLAVVSGVVIAIAVSIVLSTLVTSVTSLLR